MTNRQRCFVAVIFCLMGLGIFSDVSPRASAASQGGAVPTHFMLGIASDPNDRWMADARSHGSLFDLRYRYITGGVNTESNWKTWNKPDGQYAGNFLMESDHLGMLTCFTYYQMVQSSPGNGSGPEGPRDRTNCENAGTMKAYFADLKLLMQQCNKYGKQVIIHVEPDLWGFMTVGDAFGSNDADQIKVMVKSSGFPEAAHFDDTAAGFGKLIVAMRNAYAPKVILAWHASHWGNPDPRKLAVFLKKCGQWDIIFADVSDRDAGYKVAHGTSKAEAWWQDKDFTAFREWGGQLHKATGLPIMLWQVPIGNTFMATCNNTNGHYMDNRAEYFLENYPSNKHIAEWEANGFVGILFGGGAAGCTDVHDNEHDGVTNPTPCEGNKGYKTDSPDDDGGYLANRVANYYKDPLPLP